MGVFKPNKFFSRDGVIQNLINQSVVSNVDTVTWVTSAAQTANESSVKDVTLNATSSLGGLVTYSIVGGIDQALFSIVSDSTLRLGSQNYESPADDGSNNTYIVNVRATSNAGGSADITIVVTVQNINEQDFLNLTGSNVTGESNLWTVTVTNSSYGVADNVTFGSGLGQYLRIENTDPLNSEVEVTIESVGGNFDLAPDISGITLSIGDGTNDSLMTFTGTISGINTALNNMVIYSTVTSFIVNVVDGEFDTTYPINVNHVNGTVEQQLVTFDYVPTSGTWRLGINSDNYITIAYSDDAATIQVSLRAYGQITDAWGTNLTVTGNYTVGFTITAARYDNQTDLYINTGDLSSLQSINTYIEDVSAATWDNPSNANGTPNGGYTSCSIGIFSSSVGPFIGKLIFSGYPEITPNGIEITTYVGGPVYDTSISLYNYSAGTPLGGADKANSTLWNSAGYKVYGGASDNWGVVKTAAEWQALLGTGGSGLGIHIMAYNPDGSYSQTAQIDAVLATVYYNVVVSGSVGTITNG